MVGGLTSLPEALLFDLDGCIVDSFPSIARCWAQTLPEFGFMTPTPTEVRHHIGPPVNVAARSLAPGAHEATIGAIVAAYRRRSAQSREVKLFPGIPELLAGLANRGVLLAVATSKSIEVARPMLDRLGLTKCFAVIEGTPVHELGTDKTTIVARALDRLAPARPIALVGDREHDVHGAHANGLLAIGALWGYGSQQELLTAGADRLASTPADIPRVVSQIGERGSSNTGPSAHDVATTP